MGGKAKGISVIATVLLMYMALDLLMHYSMTLEFGIQYMIGSLWGALTGSLYMDPRMTMTLFIVVFGVISIAGALKG